MKYSVFSVFGIFASVLLLAQVNTAYAATVTISPTEITTDCQTIVTLTVSGLNVGEGIVTFEPNPNGYWYTEYTYQNYGANFQITDTFANVMGLGVDCSQLTGQTFGAWNLALINVATARASTTIDYGEGTHAVTDPFILQNNFINITEIGFTPSTMFPNGGFLGSSASGAAMVGRVISGVTTTGASVWPFLGLVGIPLAFIIGLALISFINNGAGGKRGEVDTKTVNGSEALGGKNYRTYGDKEIAKAKRDGLL